MIEVGIAIVQRGQTYRCVEVQPYVRKDGMPAALAVMESDCKRCGSPFHFRISVNTAAVHGFNRRCARHAIRRRK
jgi:hypothetical protein